MVTKSSSLRQQVFALLHESTTSAEEDLEALSQCAAHIRNRMIVEGIARDCGLTLAKMGDVGSEALYVNVGRC